MGVTATNVQFNARVYVGSYHKYNSGSIAGNWLCLDDYNDYEEFIFDACDLHRDEADPELMPQDWEGLGSDVSECGVFQRVKLLYHWASQGFNPSDDEQADSFWAFVANNCYPTLEEAFEKYQESFAGWHDSLAQFAVEFLKDTGKLDHIAEPILRYFNYDKYADDLDLNGTIWYHEQRGRVAVFWNV